MSDQEDNQVYINSVNCVILILAPALIILIYVIFIGLYCLMGGCGFLYLLKKLTSFLNSVPVRLLFQIFSYVAILQFIFGTRLSLRHDSAGNRPVKYVEPLVSTHTETRKVNSTANKEAYEAAFYEKFSYSLILSVIGLLYLLHSSISIYKWFSGRRYPVSCFSPSELKTFLNRIQNSEPYCAIKVKGGQIFPPSRTRLVKDFVPHLWTEFTESIDVVGARKNRIESAANISDVLEELLRKRKVFIIDIGVEINPEDNQSLKNTQYFTSRVLETAATKFPSTSSASFVIQIPAISQDVVETPIPLQDGTLHLTAQNDLTRLSANRLSAIVHRELDLPAFWYFIWKYRKWLLGACMAFPILGLFFQYVLETLTPRHTLELNIKYSFVPQTEPPYEVDSTVPDIDFAEPQKVTILMPSERFLVPRDSLSRIITGDIDWRQNRHLYRTPSTESSPPIMTPHTSNMAALLEHSEEYRRSRTSTGSDTNLKEGGDSPPSYTAVFISETDGLTPPPLYSNIKSQETPTPGLKGKFF